MLQAVTVLIPTEATYSRDGSEMKQKLLSLGEVFILKWGNSSDRQFRFLQIGLLGKR